MRNETSRDVTCDCTYEARTRCRGQWVFADNDLAQREDSQNDGNEWTEKRVGVYRVRRGGYSYLAVKDGARERPLQWAVNNVDGLAQIATFAMELARSKVVPRDVLVYGWLCTWGMVLSDD